MTTANDTFTIKICGLTDARAMEVALDAGADMVGLVIFEPSPRHVSFATASELAAMARGRAEIVALAVDPDDALLTAITNWIKPDWIQLHGSESISRTATIGRMTGLPVMKALGVREAADLEAIADYAEVARRILLDARPPADASRPGGLGERFDWSLLSALDPAMPTMLAGGVTPENVAEAILGTTVMGVDVSSGVESAPGIKDESRIRAFIAAAREAVEERQNRPGS